MIRVILESPYAGEIEKNVEYARLCMKDCLSRGESPMVSHLLYTQVLDDLTPEDREVGLAAGFAWIAGAEKSVVYIDRGMSKGMTQGIDIAVDLGMKVEYRSLYK